MAKATKKTARKASAKKAAVKKTAAKKTAAKKTTAKKAGAKKAPAKKTPAQKAPAKTAAAKKASRATAAKKARANKAPAKKAVAAKAPARKAAGKRLAAGRSVVSKSPAPKSAAKKVAAKKGSAKKVAVKKVAVKKSAPVKAAAKKSMQAASSRATRAPTRPGRARVEKREATPVSRKVAIRTAVSKPTSPRKQKQAPYDGAAVSDQALAEALAAAASAVEALIEHASQGGKVEGGDVVRAIAAPNTAEKRRKFFDDMNAWAQGEGFPGLGYATQKDGVFGGPIANNHGQEGMKAIADALGLGPNDGIFFAAGKEAQAAKLAGLARTRVGEQLGLIDDKRFEFCWIVDFPMF